MKPYKKEIPVSIEDFKELIDGNNCYIDKTDFIEAILHETAVVYTRPRRFGKTLNLSMLYYFYSMQEAENSYLFDGLKISASEKALKHQNKYPVIFLSLKDISGPDFSSAMESFASLIRETFSQFPDLLRSPKLPDYEKEKIDSFLRSSASLADLIDSLRFMTECLYKHYGKKTMLLIDEYDVPLHMAWKYGYYDEMCELIRNVYSRTLKSSQYLKKTVLTGCLPLSKESIFPGMNNLKVHSVSDLSSSVYFGFTQQEIDKLYTSFGFAGKLRLVKKWYGSYRFGHTDIYNPWSVLMYLDALVYDPEAEPEPYWANSSDNSIILECLKNSGPQTRQEFDDLIHGKSIVKPIREELTCRDISNPANMYTFLLHTGYLKSTGKTSQKQNELMIPSLEVRGIYEDQFESYYEYIIHKSQREIFTSMLEQEPEQTQNLLNRLLEKHISYRDCNEDFYLDIMLDLLNEGGYYISSCREAGDILLRPEYDADPLIMLELKIASDKVKLDDLARKAVLQIQNKGYLDDPGFEKYKTKIGYGIAFCDMNCRVKQLQLSENRNSGYYRLPCQRPFRKK